MSTLAENVAKVTAAHAALKTAIASKGVAVPDGTKLSAMPALVEQIQTGGATEPTVSRTVFAYDESTSIVVPKTVVLDISAASDLSYCFSYCTKMTSLTLPDGFGQAATSLYNCFAGCTALTDITGNPNFKSSLSLSPCHNLTHDSIMVVINGLQTVTGTKTLTLGSTNLAKLSDAEKKVATDKGWTLA